MMTFKTTTELYKYGKENHRNVCSCYINYPNENHKMKNGRWKCVECYEPVDGMEFNKILKKQYCLRCRYDDQQ